jgi:hypothetical protein
MFGRLMLFFCHVASTAGRIDDSIPVKPQSKACTPFSPSSLAIDPVELVGHSPCSSCMQVSHARCSDCGTISMDTFMLLTSHSIASIHPSKRYIHNHARTYMICATIAFCFSSSLMARLCTVWSRLMWSASLHLRYLRKLQQSLAISSTDSISNDLKIRNATFHMASASRGPHKLQVSSLSKLAHPRFDICPAASLGSKGASCW